ncbi:MAG: hypothetical protein BZY88_04145, partial [SAR202 cluster bacterium Io17-Chloro-G9]
MALNEPEYPVQFSVDYPDRPLNRMTTFFRLLVIIPIALVLDLVTGGGTPGVTAGLAGGAAVLAPMVMIL